MMKHFISAFYLEHKNALLSILTGFGTWIFGNLDFIKDWSEVARMIGLTAGAITSVLFAVRAIANFVFWNINNWKGWREIIKTKRKIKQNGN